jgi:NAD(P)-dependent dehydrogenase (short-subunit alcohol dehydrogenase family)
VRGPAADPARRRFRLAVTDPPEVAAVLSVLRAAVLRSAGAAAARLAAENLAGSAGTVLGDRPAAGRAIRGGRVQITGSSALVTGGASGLGLATVQLLVGAGAGVVIADLPGSPGRAAAEQLGSAVRFVPTDVTDEQQVQAAVDAASALGPLRIAVSCAGVANGIRTVSRSGPFPLADFRRVVEVNLIGTFNVIRLAADRMAGAPPDGEERGVIVNTASVAAFDGQIGQAAYSASKAGIVGLTLPVARDLAGLQIRVVTIAPGLFDTPLLGGLPADARASLGGQVPHPSRLGKPEEFGLLVTQIVANPMLNGEVIRLDGAIRMAPR